ncbi:MAG: MlaD family protein [Flavobacteriales bacterium]|jgi:phospholipid/cholesterol/gamma-HCH transport system substrate-binding protein|nr:MlaD family protein [Flavobacteriales bacterium]
MKFKKEIIVGIVASVGVTALIVGFFFLKGQNLWEKNQRFYAVYERAEGLVTGNSVVKNGVPIGVLTSVGLYPNDPSRVLVEFDVTNEWIKIPRGSIAQLEPGMLGSPQINILFSEETTNFHESGDTIFAKAKPGVFEEIKVQVLERIDPSLSKINNVIATADSSLEVMSAVLTRNTGNLDQSFEGIKNAIINFEKVSKNLDTLIAGFSGARNQIFATLENVRSITGNLKESNEEITKTLANVSVITDSIAALDLAGTLNKAQESLDNVNAILYELENGEGSLTMLLKDSTLYNNVNVMVEEAGRLVENIQEHPNRYLQFAVFGSKDKGVNLSSRDEKLLRKYVKDSLRELYKN